ncbi:hypothetical protein, partial [Heyndrickxia coagulans]
SIAKYTHPKRERTDAEKKRILDGLVVLIISTNERLLPLLLSFIYINYLLFKYADILEIGLILK